MERYPKKSVLKGNNLSCSKKAISVDMRKWPMA